MAIPYPEDRDATRFDHTSTLQVKDLSSGEIHEARMLNYSNGGIYFESDGIFPRGAKINISIQNSPYLEPSGVLEFYTGKVMWRQDLEESYYYYGYGVQLISSSRKQDLGSNNNRKGKDSRKHPRKPYCRSIQLGTHNGIINGKTINMSASGAFISADAKLELGQVLKMSLPYKGKTVKILVQVVWLDEEGFGLKFIKLK